MVNMMIQKVVYRGLVQRPVVNNGLNRLGNFINRAGIPFETGFTRNKAILFASQNPAEIATVQDALLKSQSRKAEWALVEHGRFLEGQPMRGLGERFENWMFDIGPFDEPGLILGCGDGGGGSWENVANLKYLAELLAERGLKITVNDIRKVHSLGFSNESLIDLALFSFKENHRIQVQEQSSVIKGVVRFFQICHQAGFKSTFDALAAFDFWKEKIKEAESAKTVLQLLRERGRQVKTHCPCLLKGLRPNTNKLGWLLDYFGHLEA